MKLGQIIKKLIAKNASLPAFDEEKWGIVNALVESETFEYEKNLAGYSTKRGESSSTAIMFSKEVTDL